MAAILMTFQPKRNVNMPDLFTERLLEDPDVFEFKIRMLISWYRLFLVVVLLL